MKKSHRESKKAETQKKSSERRNIFYNYYNYGRLYMIKPIAVVREFVQRTYCDKSPNWEKQKLETISSTIFAKLYREIKVMFRTYLLMCP